MRRKTTQKINLIRTFCLKLFILVYAKKENDEICYHRECRATPTSKTAHKTNSNANTATVPGQRINSY